MGNSARVQLLNTNCFHVFDLFIISRHWIWLFLWLRISLTRLRKKLNSAEFVCCPNVINLDIDFVIYGVLTDMYTDITCKTIYQVLQMINEDVKIKYELFVDNSARVQLNTNCFHMFGLFIIELILNKTFLLVENRLDSF